MATVLTTNKALSKQGTGDNPNTWGTTLNSTLDLVDQSLGTNLAKSIAGSSNVTLTAAEVANFRITFTGALTGNITVTFPNTGGFFSVQNSTSGAYTLTLAISSGTVSIIIPQGAIWLIYTNATAGTVEYLGTSGAVNAQTGTTYTIVQGDNGQLTTFSNGSAIAVTLPQAGTASKFQNGWKGYYRNIGAGTVTITPTTSTINAAATLAIATGNGAIIFSDGTNYQAITTNTGTVTSIVAGAGLSGGTITSTGTMSIDLTHANTFTGSQAGTPTTLTDGATISWDMSGGNNYEIILGGNRTLGAPTNATKGQSGSLNVIQDTTGSRTLAFAWPYTFGAGTAPTLTTTALAWDKLVYDVVRAQSATVSATNASPCVITWTGHGLKTGDFFQFTSGTQPAGFSLNTTYWINTIDANTFRASTTKANAAAGTFINSTSTGTSPVATATHVNVAFKGDFR